MTKNFMQRDTMLILMESRVGSSTAKIRALRALVRDEFTNVFIYKTSWCLILAVELCLLIRIGFIKAFFIICRLINIFKLILIYILLLSITWLHCRIGVAVSSTINSLILLSLLILGWVLWWVRIRIISFMSSFLLSLFSQSSFPLSFAFFLL
jgi:hypothetical protein